MSGARFTLDMLAMCPACGRTYVAALGNCPRCPPATPGMGQDRAEDKSRVCTRPEVQSVSRVTVARFGKCPHTGRAYRSKTEARWAAEHPDHSYEPVGIRTCCGVYWPDFLEVTLHGRLWLYEVKGAWIRDRSLHKVKAAIRPAIDAGYDGIWLAQWDGKAWQVTEVREG